MRTLKEKCDKTRQPESKEMTLAGPYKWAVTLAFCFVSLELVTTNKVIRINMGFSINKNFIYF